MNEEERLKLEDAVCDKYGLDVSEVEHLSDAELAALLKGQKEEPEKQEKPAPITRRRTIKEAPRRESWQYVEHGGKLCRLEHWSDGGEYRVQCGERVRFEGRTVSAAVVLHWVRTGEWVKRAPRASKTVQAAIRIDGRVMHLGRFATIEEAQAAKDAARALLGKTPRK